ncbi:ABC transporter substrate-binding protein [Rickettsiales endosymbiont of Stachyamoeba lipophora]|uniref:ABC transporter substrate-binding protein n=1 Tax=Rickettsiales endosymbiont of Stachyamoeba lipophora TaxID=2486578 RepID=UPI000F647904|nr:ABC transporter substrate-binding protein [Rickettsiales endosymbiont of Stachyamoeba lipophora]AZL15289.1 ABC transporter substrate-binding protein [Rickettsiales endosymbiont of Stachyamoeba lipophora]
MQRMIIIKLIAAISILLCIPNIYAAQKDNKPTQVMILKIIDHPALDQTTKGIIDYLGRNQTVTRKFNIHTESAQGQPILAKQIAQKYVSQEPEIIIAVGTSAAQAFLPFHNQTKNPVIFTSVTDAITAGLADNNNIPHLGFTGISNHVPVKEQMKFFRSLQPQLKKIGTIYNPSEINSVKALTELENYCQEQALDLVIAPATKATEAAQATYRLINEAEAIFINNDNNALSAIKIITNIAKSKKVPVYSSDTDTIPLGAIAAYGVDQYKLGEQTAELALQILKDPKKIYSIQKAKAVIHQANH